MSIAGGWAFFGLMPARRRLLRLCTIGRTLEQSKSYGLRLDGGRVIFDRSGGLEERLIAVEELIDILDEAT